LIAFCRRAFPDARVCRKLDRLARSVPDARAIAEQLETKGVKLALGASVYDPMGKMGKMFFNILATFAEFESDLIRMRRSRAIWALVTPSDTDCGFLPI
jgi:DNA invertase Pin-like site-specific DNA recombinase